LIWQSDGATSVTIEPNIGTIATSGTATITPEKTTTYTATATGPSGTSVARVTVNVVQPSPVLTFQTDKTAILEGTSAVLSWTSDFVDRVILDPGFGVVDLQGSVTVTPTMTSTYKLTGVGLGGDVSKFVTVGVYPLLDLQVTSPVDGITTDSPSITVSGQISKGANVTVNGTPATIAGNTFTAEITVATPGAHTITVRAADNYGQEKTVVLTVTYIPELTLSISSPADTQILYTSPAQISGQVSNNAAVTVNGVAATVTGDTFAAAVPLSIEGEQALVVEAVDTYGQQISASVSVLYFTMPTVSISADKLRIVSGDSVTLTWESLNCLSATLEPNIGNVDCNGTITLPVTATTDFVIRATGATKTDRARVAIVVDDPYGNPSPEEQAHLEAINKARANPLTEAARLNIDLNEGPPEETISPDPVPPLRFNELLHRAAIGHSLDMIENNYFAHDGSDGSTPAERCAAEGYVGGTGENIAAESSSIPPADLVKTSRDLHDALFIDYNYPGRGHRVNMLREGWKEVGVGFRPGSVNAGVLYGGAVTCNFGDSSAGGASLIGLVFDDKNQNQAYDLNEGISGALIKDLESGGQVYTASAGGYSLPLSPGEHTIEATLPDGRKLTKQVVMARENIKLDFLAEMFSNPDPTVTLMGDVQAVRPGESAQLIWHSANSDYAELDNGLGFVPANGSLTVSPATTTTYTITATGSSKTAVSSFTVYVTDFTAVPTLNFSAAPDTIDKGESTTLYWTTQNAAYAHIDNGVGAVLLNGSVVVTPQHSTTYTITVTSPAGVVNQKVRVFVIGNPSAQPAGSFGSLYNDQIPADATVDAYAPERFSLITGNIEDISGSPLSGVTVTILDHPEYGTATTDGLGEYTLPVEGGFTLTVMYDLVDHLSAQRQVYVPVNDVGIANTVQLLQEDPLATDVVFDGNPNSITVHKSSVIRDAFGERSISMVFQGDNRAYVVDENGQIVRTLTSFTTRATEYQTPESMPAELPKTSAFTYCSELAVDGVDRVRFAKPVVTWVDNFLGFDVGFVVPSGYYDRDKGIWVADRNGIVVELLDTNGDGLTDAVDSDGDGYPNDLNNNMDIRDEALGLSDPQSYPPGATFWRVEVTHFTPWDYNICSFMSLLKMLGYAMPSLDGQSCPFPDQSCTGSSVESEALVFHEDIAIPGTGLSLSYSSDRTDGFKNVITVPVSGSEVPVSVKSIVVEIDIAGQKLIKNLPPEPNQVAEFIWDGLDWLGNRVYHRVKAHVKIGYAYDSYYMKSGYLEMAFAEFGTSITNVPTRDEVISWQRSDLTINVADKMPGIAQGWNISAHHQLSPTDPTTLHKGDGSVAKNITSVMKTVAGNGTSGWATDGMNALQTPIGNPTSVAMDSEGNLYVANQEYSSILKIDQNNIVEVIAGGLNGRSEEDDIAAKDALIQMPVDIAFDNRGNLYIADAGSNKIRKIDRNGIITTVAGNGLEESSGDLGLAVDAGIMPTSVAVDDFGNIYFAEGSTCVGGEVDPVTGQCIGGTIVDSSYRVRKISTNGLISTIVGTGEQYDPNVHASNGDGGHASEAYLLSPTSVSVDRDGNLYIADGTTIRKVNSSGTITTVAGTGAYGYLGDGGLATDAQITHASGVVFDNQGNFYFSQFYGNGDVIRKVSSNGYISTVAGAGEPGLDGDYGPATHALLQAPQRLAMDLNGFIIVPDKGNGLVRKVFLDSYQVGETHFVEANGLGHLISQEGYHTITYDLETGLPLLTFAYDSYGQLSTITDQFGNVVSIETMGGIPSVIISADGLRTELTIDSNNQLTKLTYPDTSFYNFEYTNNDGLLTAKNEPNGNRFEHFFDEKGRVTATNNAEGGLWQFARTKAYDGTTTSSIDTPNTTKSVKTTISSTGAVEKTTTTSSGEIISTAISADGLDSASQPTCGPKVETWNDLDRWYGYTYQQASRVTTPTGLELTTSVVKDYSDADSDNLPEKITSQVTVNGKTTSLVHDTLNSSRVITSPENRTVSTKYDPNSLLTTSTTVPGLFSTQYSYLSDGKLQSVAMGTRKTAYTYDSFGNVATITDPQNRTTAFPEYDKIGRVIKAVRPDNTVLSYGYDNNGNMTLLVTPTPADNSFTYNGVNKRSTYQTPLGYTTSYSYNAERQPTKVILPSTKEIINTYASGRLTQTTTSEWTTNYTYSCGDLLGSITRGTEALAYTYDGNLPTAINQSGTIKMN
jgi:YD repeat-containing protein